ncbi:FAD-dependent oxidoreductase [Bacillus niameyensis]|uniref:FAD-dependent oxidoreductase n=1 Tax=Bacillus niameyensis TaxID=1522308 RepID=UPI00078564F7|nr:FAD-dependent oxidoreductase [Bacillus niameyensis]
MSQNRTSEVIFPPSWWIQSLEMPTFPALDHDMNVDVAIIGAGITGISIAYLLAKEGMQTAIFEASKVLNGTTGHTTAKVTSQHGVIFNELISHFGEDGARLYYEANHKAIEQIEKMVNDHNIDCSFQKEDAYIYTNDENYIEKLKLEADAYKRLGIDGEYSNDIPINIPYKAAVVMRNQAHFHPLRYLVNVLELFKKEGGQVFENSVATHMEDGDPPIVSFRNGNKVKAKYVISASHFPFHDSQGYFARLSPNRSYVIAGKPMKSFQGGMYINAEQPTRSIRPVTINNEEMLLFSGENHKAGQGEPEKDHYEALKKFATEHFGVKEILYQWSAQDLITPDKLPYIGRLSTYKNLFVATGFRKWGMTTSHVAANLIKDLIIGNANPYEQLFSPSRFKADPGIKKMIKENLNVATHLISGKFDRPDKELKDIHNGEGAVITIKGKRAGAYKTNEGKLYVVDTTCTHMGCEVNWNSGDQTWDCPCHGSRFSFEGEVIEGPAEKPLKTIDPDEIDYTTS